MIGKSLYRLSPDAYDEAYRIQQHFIAYKDNLAYPPKFIQNIRFYLIDEEDEDTTTTVNAAINFFSQRNHLGEGGVWLQETFEDNGVTYATAAVWW